MCQFQVAYPDREVGLVFESTSPASPTEMDVNTENVTETSRISKDEPQKTLVDNTFRGRGFRSRGRMSRDGMRGGRGMIKGFGPPGYGRDRGREGAMKGFAPMRGMRRMRPYPDMRGHRGRGGPMGMGPPPPPPPMHLRGPFPPMHRHGPRPPPSSRSPCFQRASSTPSRLRHAPPWTSTPLSPPRPKRLPQWTSLSSSSPPTWQRPEVARAP
ncbi:hypothetical protein CesoFtcFv8_023074 [Champsocephalus esox]|uniref:Uncharacterized protein n=1 Tax=Champsocephalus esox TaxID=159716 RepID=A0AAN8B8Q7_9TELE|nr:hypothetical protein CesoFtcFv8_023074 [Champsocephalus esox]